MCSISNRSQNKEKIAAVLLENTFTSIPDIARLLFPFRLKCNSSFHDSCNKCSCGCRIIKWLPVWFYKNQFKSGRKACRITQPTLFLSGLSDQVKCLKKYLKRKKSEISLRFLQLIPPKMMTDLYTTCGAPVKRLARWKCFFLMDLIFSQLSFC